MRLCRLDLTRFGHFSDFTLDLGQDGADFHVILGPNEAGKSTLVEAWLNLLYGIPGQSSYTFRHPRNTLEIRAVVDDGAGATTLVRTPQRTNNLLGADGAPVPQAVLEAMLRGVSEDAYRALYCLNDETIEKGGDDILASRGDLGQLLFAAASGLEAFNADLEAERTLDRSFHRRGQGQRSTDVYTLKKDLADLDAARREIDVAAPDYRRLRDAAGSAVAADDAARQRHQELKSQEATLRARLTALPVKDDLERLSAELAELGDVPEIALDAEDVVSDLAERRTSLLGTLRTRRADLAEKAAERDGLPVDDLAADLAVQLADLSGLRERAATDAEDLPRRRDEWAAHRDAAARLLGDLGLAGTDPAAVHLPRPALEALDRAVRAHATALRDLAVAEQERERAQQALEEAQSEAGQVGTPPDPTVLRSLLVEQDAARLAEDLAGAVRTRDQAAARALAECETLSVGAVAFAACPDVALTPDAATALAERLRRDEARLEDLRSRLAEDEAQIARLQARKAARAEHGPDVSDAAARAVRARRDDLWRAHRGALTGPTADAFAEALAEEDALTSLRLAESARLADLRQLEAALAEAAAMREARAAELEAAGRDLSAGRDDLAGHLAAIGLPATLGAATLATWLANHARAAAAERALAQAGREVEDLRQRTAPVWTALAAELGEASPAAPEALVRRAKERLAGIETHQTRHRGARRAVELAEAEAARRSQELDSAARAQASAEQDLGNATAELELVQSITADLSDALPVLRELAAECAEMAKLSDRIAKMEQNCAAFARAIEPVAAAWPDLADEPPLVRAASLDRIAGAARKTLDRRERLTDEIAAIERQIAEAGRELDAVDAEAERLARDFPGAPRDFDAIRTVIVRAAKAARLRADLRRAEERLTALLGTATAAAALGVLAEATEPALQGELDLLAPDLKAAEAARDEAIAARIRAQDALARVSGDDDAARLAQERETVMEDLRARTEAGLARRLALMLADRALARYRDRHRSAMLKDTGDAFARLTGGAYPALSAQATEKGEVLIARRASDGRSLRADETSMSKGTRFQLYLALRLAGYRQMAGTGTVLPFVCDDVFETFDEARTAAACELMHQIARGGQALYFTHHAHVAQIAREVCGDQVRVHQI